MLIDPKPPLTILDVGAAPVIAMLFITGLSFLKEPARRNLSAIMLAGAGAAYLSGGGLGPWEFAFCALMSWIAYRGLADYRFIGAGWLLHTAWDVVHHLYGNPIVPFVINSSAGCAICDLGLAFWYFRGAPSIVDLLTGRHRNLHVSAAR